MYFGKVTYKNWQDIKDDYEKISFKELLNRENINY